MGVYNSVESENQINEIKKLESVDKCSPVEEAIKGSQNTIHLPHHLPP